VLIGYARVSTVDQNLDLQRDALTRAGCERLFEDRNSGAKSARPGLEQALSHARAGDTFVVWKLDRLGRSLQHLIETVNSLAPKFRPNEVKVGSKGNTRSGGWGDSQEESSRSGQTTRGAESTRGDPKRLEQQIGA
jgi:hypothetical protein